MKTRADIYVAVLLAVLVAASGQVAAQTGSTDTAALRASIERRFDVLPLRDGVALRPKAAASGVRSIEITSGLIAIDGQPATGVELRDKLGADADLVLALSYLSDSDRGALFNLSSTPSEPSIAPAAPTPPAPPVRSSQNRGRRIGRGSDDGRVHIGGSVAVAEGEVIDGDVVAIGGSARVDGEVHGGVVAVGGSVTLGPHASVEDDVVVVGGQLHRSDSARVGGKVSEIGIGALNFGSWRWNRPPFGMGLGPMFGSAFALVGTITRLAILSLFAAIVLLFGRTYAERIGTRAAAEPLKAGAIGLLAQLLFLPILVVGIVLLVVTIIGIPLLLLVPFVLLGLAIVGLVGFTGVAHHLGRVLAARFNWSADNPYLTTVTGIVLLLSPLLLARLAGLAGGIMFPLTMGLGLLGALVEYLAWTIGFGAVALVRFQPISPVPPAAVIVETQGPTSVGP